MMLDPASKKSQVFFFLTICRLRNSAPEYDSACVGLIDIKNTWISVIELPTVEVGWLGMIKCRFRAFEFEGARPSYLEKEDEVVIVMLVRRDENGSCSRLAIGEIDPDAWARAGPEEKSICLV